MPAKKERGEKIVSRVKEGKKGGERRKKKQATSRVKGQVGVTSH